MRDHGRLPQVSAGRRGPLLVGVLWLAPAVAGGQIRSIARCRRRLLTRAQNGSCPGQLRRLGYSPLDQITTQKRAKLTPVWTLGTASPRATSRRDGQQRRHVRSTPQNQVLALDAKNGDVLWYYQEGLARDLLQLHPDETGAWGLRGQGLPRHGRCPPVALDPRRAGSFGTRSRGLHRGTTARWRR